MRTVQRACVLAALLSLAAVGSHSYAQEFEEGYESENGGLFEESGIGGEEESGIGSDWMGGEESWESDEYGAFGGEYDYATDDESFDGWYGNSEDDWLDWNGDIF